MPTLNTWDNNNNREIEKLITFLFSIWKAWLWQKRASLSGFYLNNIAYLYVPAPTPKDKREFCWGWKKNWETLNKNLVSEKTEAGVFKEILKSFNDKVLAHYHFPFSGIITSKHFWKSDFLSLRFSVCLELPDKKRKYFVHALHLHLKRDKCPVLTDL